MRRAHPGIGEVPQARCCRAVSVSSNGTGIHFSVHGDVRNMNHPQRDCAFGEDACLTCMGRRPAIRVCPNIIAPAVIPSTEAGSRASAPAEVGPLNPLVSACTLPVPSRVLVRGSGRRLTRSMGQSLADDGCAIRRFSGNDSEITCVGTTIPEASCALLALTCRQSRGRYAGAEKGQASAKGGSTSDGSPG